MSHINCADWTRKGLRTSRMTALGPEPHIERPIRGKMADKPWKATEREVARHLGSSRYPANSGGRVDVESPTLVVQVKHVQRMSLVQLETLAVEMEEIGKERGKVGVVPVPA